MRLWQMIKKTKKKQLKEHYTARLALVYFGCPVEMLIDYFHQNNRLDLLALKHQQRWIFEHG